MTDPNSRSVVSVELAYPLHHDGHRYEPDALVELPRTMAKQLVRDGRARWPKTQETPAPAPATGTATAAPGQDNAAGTPA